MAWRNAEAIPPAVAAQQREESRRQLNIMERALAWWQSTQFGNSSNPTAPEPVAREVGPPPASTSALRSADIGAKPKQTPRASSSPKESPSPEKTRTGSDKWEPEGMENLRKYYEAVQELGNTP